MKPNDRTEWWSFYGNRQVKHIVATRAEAAVQRAEQHLKGTWTFLEYLDDDKVAVKQGSRIIKITVV